MPKKDYEDLMSPADKIGLGLLNRHTQFLTGEIEPANANEIIKWLVYEDTLPKSDQILTLYINSPGGSLTDALAIIDVMNAIEVPICTIGCGAVWSAAFLIFISGSKGYRGIGKNSSILCHQYSDEIIGKHHDIKAQMHEMIRTNERMISVIGAASGLTDQIIKSKLLPPSDVWLSPQEMVDLGLADTIY